VLSPIPVIHTVPADGGDGWPAPPGEPDPGLSTIAALSRLTLSVERAWRAVAAENGLMLGDVTVLSAVIEAGGASTPSQLIDQLAMRSATLTSVLDRLEKSGFLRRVSNPRDRRSVLVTLGSAGRRFVEVGERRAREIVAESVGAGADAPLMAALLDRLSCAIDRQAELIGRGVDARAHRVAH
jgi:DNA-binding MarR family transcriptional regulator